MSEEVCKIVVVGDGEVGKTCMIYCYLQNTFPEQYMPTVFDAFKCFLEYENKQVELKVWDTAGQEDMNKIRPLAFPGCNCFLVCFSLVDRNSFKNAICKWRDELLLQGPSKCPMILVGLKQDLREEHLSEGKDCITTQEGQQMK